MALKNIPTPPPPIDEQVMAARTVVGKGQFTVTDLAAYWGVDEAKLRAAVFGATHAHITDPPPLVPDNTALSGLAVEPLITEPMIDTAWAIEPRRDAKARIICGVEGCGRAHAAYGYCHTHLKRVQRGGDPDADVPVQVKVSNAGAICKVEGCATPINNQREGYVEKGALGMCRAHYRAAMNREKTRLRNAREVIFA